MGQEIKDLILRYLEAEHVPVKETNGIYTLDGHRPSIDLPKRFTFSEEKALQDGEANMISSLHPTVTQIINESKDKGLYSHLTITDSIELNETELPIILRTNGCKAFGLEARNDSKRHALLLRWHVDLESVHAHNQDIISTVIGDVPVGSEEFIQDMVEQGAIDLSGNLISHNLSVNNLKEKSITEIKSIVKLMAKDLEEKYTDDMKKEKERIKDYFESYQDEFKEDIKKMNQKINDERYILNTRNFRSWESRDKQRKKIEKLKEKLKLIEKQQENEKKKLANKLREKVDKIDKDYEVEVTATVINSALVSLNEDLCSCTISQEEKRNSKVDFKYLPSIGLITEFPKCVACSKEVLSGALCSNGHYVCQQCIDYCVNCHHELCTECADDGFTSCSICNEVFCNTHDSECAVCDSQVCDHHLRSCEICMSNSCFLCQDTCNVCQREVCHNHSILCEKCEEHVCDDDCSKCGICKSQQCNHHLVTCTKCQGVYCDDHTSLCIICNEAYCDNHLESCEICSEPACAEHTHSCSICERTVCEGHIQSCSVCGISVCVEHASRCNICGAIMCTDHSETCQDCGFTLCPDHVGHCHTCDKLLCPDDSFTCYRDGQIHCADHINRCTICDNLVCKQHSRNCSYCDKPACGKHLKQCKVCKKIMCTDHTKHCAICGDTHCPDDTEKCKLCGQYYCKKCVSLAGTQKLCDTCKTLRPVDISKVPDSVKNHEKVKILEAWKGENDIYYVFKYTYREKLFFKKQKLKVFNKTRYNLVHEVQL